MERSFVSPPIVAEIQALSWRRRSVWPTTRDSTKLLLPSTAIIAPFAAFSEFLPIRPETMDEWMERGQRSDGLTDWLIRRVARRA